MQKGSEPIYVWVDGQHSGENDADTFFYIFFPLFYVKLLSIFTFSQNSSATIWVKKINVWKHGKQSSLFWSCSEFAVHFESSSQNSLGIQCLLSVPLLPSFFILLSSFHCNLLFLCPQNCSSRYPQYLGQWMITYMLLNGEPLKSDVELFTVFWSVMK